MRNILAIIGFITVYQIAEPPVRHVYRWATQYVKALDQKPVVKVQK